jgi:hypothetical protein
MAFFEIRVCIPSQINFLKHLPQLEHYYKGKMDAHVSQVEHRGPFLGFHVLGFTGRV